MLSHIPNAGALGMQQLGLGACYSGRLKIMASKEMADVGIGQVDFFFGNTRGIKLHFGAHDVFFWSTQLDDLLQHERWRCVLGVLLGHGTPYGDRIKLTTFNSSNSIVLVHEHTFPYNPYSYFYIKYRTLSKLKVWAFWLPSPPKGCQRFDIFPSLFHPFSSIFYGLPTAAPTITC